MEGFVSCHRLLGPGIYMLLLKGKVVYVGQSNRVMQRLSTHSIDVTEFDDIMFLPCNECDLRRLEAYYIDLHQPARNVMRPMPWPERRIDLASLGLKRRTMRRRRV